MIGFCKSPLSLESGPGIADTKYRPAAEYLIGAALRATHAWTNFFRLSLKRLLGPQGISYQNPTQINHVGITVFDNLLGVVGVRYAIGCNDGHRDGFFNIQRQKGKGSPGQMHGQLWDARFMPTTGHIDGVHAGLFIYPGKFRCIRIGIAVANKIVSRHTDGQGIFGAQTFT